MELNSKQKKIIICIIAIIIIGIFIYQIIPSKGEQTIESVSAKSLEQSQESTQQNEEETSQLPKTEQVYIHIIGEVNNPGIVTVENGARIIDVIESAGGTTENADISQVNLAFAVSDGQKIKIPSFEETKNVTVPCIIEENNPNIVIEDGNSTNLKDKQIERVNINTANQTELETLPGVGPSLASKIITHRKENGKFKKIEEIQNVNGIGESKYNNIKNFIIVK